MKKFSKIISFVGMFAICMLLFVGCGEHKHTLGDWQTDDSEHWKVCSECNEKVELASHTYQNGECTACGKTESVSGSEGLTYQHYNSDQNSWTVTGIGTCTDSVITIPQTYQGKSVVSIGTRAFEKAGSSPDTVTKIIIPSTVTNIGGYAFNGRTSEIEFINPTITAIGEYAFRGYNGVSLTIPKTVTSIGQCAFMRCENLISFTFEDGIEIEELPGNIFYECSSLLALEIPASVKRLTCDYYLNLENGTFKNVPAVITFEEGSQLEFIGNFYFLGFKGTVVLPESYTKVDEYAFYSRDGAKIILPATVTEIESNGLSSWDSYYGHESFSELKIFFMGSQSQWDTIIANSASNSLGDYTVVYVADEWELVNGVPTAKSN